MKGDSYLTKFCEQAVYDGIDILSLSVGPNSPPATTKTTFLNPFDATLLSAVKAGVFVAQAAGNGGPFPKTLVSYSPWIASVAAAIDDRRYKNHLTLGNGKILPGLGLSRKYLCVCSKVFSVAIFLVAHVIFSVELLANSLGSITWKSTYFLQEAFQLLLSLEE